MMMRMLKTADPRIVPRPTGEAATKTPRKEVASSGAEDPAAMKVAPATSGGRLRPYLVDGRIRASMKGAGCFSRRKSVKVSRVPGTDHCERIDERSIANDGDPEEEIDGDNDVRDSPRVLLPGSIARSP